MLKLTEKMMNGIVSDIPVVKSKKVTNPAVSNKVIDIPDFMKERKMEYAQRQAELYAHARMTRWQHFKKAISDLFFE